MRNANRKTPRSADVTVGMLASAAEALAATINLNFKPYGGAWAQRETSDYL